MGRPASPGPRADGSLARSSPLGLVELRRNCASHELAGDFERLRGRIAWGRVKEYEVYEDTEKVARLDEYLAADEPLLGRS